MANSVAIWVVVGGAGGGSGRISAVQKTFGSYGGGGALTSYPSTVGGGGAAISACSVSTCYWSWWCLGNPGYGTQFLEQILQVYALTVGGAGGYGATGDDPKSCGPRWLFRRWCRRYR